MKKYKVLFIDMDDTLIRTRSGKKYARGIYDMEIKIETLEAIKALAPKYVMIVTNQGGIEKKIVTEHAVRAKVNYLAECIKEYCKKSVVWAMGEFSKTMDPNDRYRKPNPGLLEDGIASFAFKEGKDIDRSECLMVGDASGLKGNWSDIDKKVAENFGCDYMDINDFYLEMGVKVKSEGDPLDDTYQLGLKLPSGEVHKVEHKFSMEQLTSIGRLNPTEKSLTLLVLERLYMQLKEKLED